MLRGQTPSSGAADGSTPDAVTSTPVEPDPPMVTETTQPRRPAPMEPAHGQATWISITPASARRTTLMVIGFFIVLSIGIWAFQALGTFLFILLLAWLFSIAMEPPVLWMVRRGVRRGLATGIVLILGLIVILGLTALFGGVFVSQLSDLASSLPNTLTSVINWVNATFHTSFDLNNIAASIQITPDKIGEWVGQYGGGLLGIFGSVFAGIFDTLTILVFAYYFSADSPRLRQTIGSWLPPAYQRYFVTVWEISVEKTGGYVVSKVALAALSAFFHAVFFAIIGVPYWLPLGRARRHRRAVHPDHRHLHRRGPAGPVHPGLRQADQRPVDRGLRHRLPAARELRLHPAHQPPDHGRPSSGRAGSVIAGAALFGPIGALIGIPLAAAALSIIDTFTHRHELLPELASLEDAENRQDEDARAEQDRHSQGAAGTRRTSLPLRWYRGDAAGSVLVQVVRLRRVARVLVPLLEAYPFVGRAGQPAGERLQAGRRQQLVGRPGGPAVVGGGELGGPP